VLCRVCARNVRRGEGVWFRVLDRVYEWVCLSCKDVVLRRGGAA